MPPSEKPIAQAGTKIIAKIARRSFKRAMKNILKKLPRPIVKLTKLFIGWLVILYILYIIGKLLIQSQTVFVNIYNFLTSYSFLFSLFQLIVIILFSVFYNSYTKRRFNENLKRQNLTLDDLDETEKSRAKLMNSGWSIFSLLIVIFVMVHIS